MPTVCKNDLSGDRSDADSAKEYNSSTNVVGPAADNSASCDTGRDRL